jgi:YHS domain-containing protein
MGGARQILLTATILLACSRGLSAQSRIEWVGSWAEAQALAARHQRLVLIHFWSQDCAPCLKLERSVFNQPEFVRAVSTNYVPWKVNVTENPAVARDFGVDRWPTDVVLSASGQELYRGASPVDANRYIATLDQIASHARLGMPAGVNPGPDVAPSSIANGVNHASAFLAESPPAGSAYQPPMGYQPPTGTQSPSGVGNPGAYTAQSAYNPATPYGPTNVPMLPANPGTVYGPPSSNPPPTTYGPPGPTYGATTPPAAKPVPEAPRSPAYVMNQWVAPESTAARPPQAEQRVSYTTPYGGEFQPLAGPARNVPADNTASPFPVAPSVPPLGAPGASTVILGPPSYDTTVTPPSMTAPGVSPSTLGPPTSVEQPPLPPATDTGPAGLDGYCPVTLVEQEKWVRGDPKWGARHRGRLYFFLSPEAQKRFLDDFNKYAPALSGYDAVKYSEQGKLVDGKRAHGVFYRSQIYLFADEAALQQFWTAPERYAATVRAEQQRSAMRSGLQR